MCTNVLKQTRVGEIPKLHKTHPSHSVKGQGSCAHCFDDSALFLKNKRLRDIETKMSGCLDKVDCRCSCDCDCWQGLKDRLTPKRNMLASVVSGILVSSSRHVCVRYVRVFVCVCMCVTIFNYLTVFCWLVGSH